MDVGTELKETKEIAETLSKYANQNGRDVITTWNDWLEWCCGVFEWTAIDKAGGLTRRFEEMQKANPLFFDAMLSWFELAVRRIRTDGAYDSFGAIYEAKYQSSFKAKSAGQFFTPMTICDLMARTTSESNKKCLSATEDIVTFNDCACGSGRTLLSAWKICDKYNRNLFYAGDLDSTSVYMCALNFLIHGMVGTVEKRDALTREWHFAFIVNACKVPYANNFSCLQYYDDEAEYGRALHAIKESARAWDIVDYRPRKERPKEAIELSLF